MDLANLSRHLRLEAEIAVERFGLWLPLAGLLLAVGLLLWLLVIPSLQVEIMLQKEQLAILKAAKRLTQPTITTLPDKNSQNLAFFEQTLALQKEQPATIHSLFTMARKQGLTLDQAKYKNSHHPQSYYDTTQITLPLQGSYSAIRHFSLAVLGALPFCSIDEMAFEREIIGTDQVDAQLRLTLWLRPMSSEHTQTPSSIGEDR